MEKMKEEKAFLKRVYPLVPYTRLHTSPERRNRILSKFAMVQLFNFFIWILLLSVGAYITGDVWNINTWKRNSNIGPNNMIDLTNMTQIINLARGTIKTLFVIE